MSDNIAQFPDLCDLSRYNIEDILNTPDSNHDELANIGVSDNIVQVMVEQDHGPAEVVTMINLRAPEMEVAWSGNQIGDQNINNTDICNDYYLNLPDNTEPTQDSSAASSTKPSKKRRRGKASPGSARVNTTRKRCKEEVPFYEDRRSALCEETAKVEKEIQLKHSNLAGHYGERFDVKVLTFSQEQEKSSLEAKVEELEAAYPDRRRCRTQKQAGYVDFLRGSYLPVREDFLDILKAELKELDRELEENIN